MGESKFFENNRKILGNIGEEIAQKELERLGYIVNSIERALVSDIYPYIECRKLQNRFYKEKNYDPNYTRNWIRNHEEWLQFCEKCYVHKHCCMESIIDFSLKTKKIISTLCQIEKKVLTRLELDGTKRTDRWPDFLAYKDGEIWLVEVKVNTSSLTKGQKFFIEEVRKELGIRTIFIHIKLAIQIKQMKPCPLLTPS